MKGWGIRVQVGRTHAEVTPWPWAWEIYTSSMAPNLYGLGVWVTRDRWAA